MKVWTQRIAVAVAVAGILFGAIQLSMAITRAISPPCMCGVE